MSYGVNTVSHTIAWFRGKVCGTNGAKNGNTVCDSVLTPYYFAGPRSLFMPLTSMKTAKAVMKNVRARLMVLP